MIFATPWVLLALTTLPLLWWLLRVTPPAPRTETFPALRLLLGLRATEETPARTPWWLLALRLLAAALIVVALARPVLDAGAALPGDGPVLLVIDNGWAAAPGWQKRVQAAEAALDRAERAGRKAALLATAADDGGAAPAVTAPMPVPDLRARLAALRPQPWPVDRTAAAAALGTWHQTGTSAIYIGDGLADPGFPAFAQALSASGAVTQLCCDANPVRALLPPGNEADRLIARLSQVPVAAATQVAVLAQSGDGRTLARTTIDVPAGATTASAPITLPSELRNTLTRLVLGGPASAGSVMLLDERWRRRPVGLLAGDLAASDAPFAGDLFYLNRALSPFGEVRTGDLKTLLSRDLAVLILADRPLPAGAERDTLAKWVEKGGLLIRFAGPRMAEAQDTDALLPVRLLGGDRQLGGALSWSEPAGLAPFAPSSPFAGLTPPAEVKVSRQVLAEPSAGLPEHTWAALTDGTPLVTQTAMGSGRLVLFHVTANAAWSNLPLSGLFVDMLRRLTAQSAGVAMKADATVLAPAETLDGYGVLSPPPRAATGLAANAFATTAVSPAHPPGLYGPESGRQALNLGATLPPLTAAPPIPGARFEPLADSKAETPLGPALITIAVAILLADLLISLALRGLLRTRVVATAALLLLAVPAHALETVANPALATRLGYIVTGDDHVDGIAKAGLIGLSDFVNRRTSATLAQPDPIEPGVTDLSFYPLLYWPIVANAPALTPAQTAALNDYMSRGGIILVDTRESGSGAGFAPGTENAFRRMAQGLTIPALTPLTTDHVLSRAFYLLNDFPGRFTGDPVWVQRDQDRANDSVSPVIIGGNDWASAWAVDAAGNNPYAVIPGGQRQRVMAYRFGLNIVMYALTGNYKGDQVHVPAILQRLGQ
jgi:Domain of unknown function (DUF4159)/Aerotolerance regulator N-terminal